MNKDSYNNKENNYKLLNQNKMNHQHREEKKMNNFRIKNKM